MASGSDMSHMRMLKENIIKELKKVDVSTVVLYGDTGMGKTWLAREISECPIDKDEFYWYDALWVNVTQKYGVTQEYAVDLFRKDIARQFYLCCNEEWKYREEKKEDDKRIVCNWGYEDQEEETIDKLTENVKKKLSEIGHALSKGKNYVLLVLDDEGNSLIYNDWHDKQWQKWKSVFPSDFPYDQLKIIITRRNNKTESQSKIKMIAVKPREQAESLTLLQNSVEKKVSDNSSFDRLKQTIAARSKGVPAAIIVIAKALNYIVQQHDASKLESALIKAAYYNEKTSQVVNPLIYCACEMIGSSDTKNCFWLSMILFRNYGGLHYNDLITHWIMEGYFDSCKCIEEAYRKAHGVLMELIDRSPLKIQDNNIVAVEGAAMNMIDSCPIVFSGTPALRLSSVFKNDEILGRVARMDGMIKTLCYPKVWEQNSTLVIDGSDHISREVHQKFSTMKELKVLAVFKARCEPLIKSLSNMDKLRVLVLRRCDRLDDIAHISKFKKLEVLEISGHRDNHLTSMPDKLLEGLTHLQSLNLSGQQMTSLPSLSNLRELRSLILRLCSQLKEVQSLEELVNLEILDLSRASSLKSLPSFSKPSELRVLILSGCSDLKELQSLQGLGKLEILDLSGASSLKSMPSNLFDEITNLQSLNLSGLKQIESLPSFSKLSELRVLNLSRCSRLKELQSLQGLDKLQILDISDASSFERFGDKTLSVLPRIQMIDLSNTNIQSLPEIDELKDLTQIFLSGCCNLSNLPKLQLLTSLQILDLSGAIMFKTFADRSIARLNQLIILDLSRTSVGKLPSIPPNLLELNLRGCLELEDQLQSTVYLENVKTVAEGWAPTRQRFRTSDQVTFL